jgi:hypothetical protein
MRTRGLRGGSFVRSLPFTLLLMDDAKAERRYRKCCAKKRTRFPATSVLRAYESTKREIISTINGLIETLKDGQEGFRQASDAVKDSQLETLFSEYSLQRSKFAGELQNEAIILGEHRRVRRKLK